LERELVVLRVVLRFAPPVLRFAAPVVRLELPGLAAPADDFVELRAEDPPVFFAAEERDEVPPLLAREEVDVRRLVLLALRPPVLRVDPELEREPALAPVLRLPPLLLELADPSIENLPDRTRCAASATASAISEPSLVALDMTDLAALSAVSAASIPASFMAFRALGLALIAAAAAARPAAIISLLIAALANLSVVLLPDPFERDEDEREDEEREELFRVLDFAICKSPLRSPHLHLA
jgi:hypothetical protein